MLALETYQAADNGFMCIENEEWGRKLIKTIISNIYFNNEQQIKNGNRKDEVATFKVRQTMKDKQINTMTTKYIYCFFEKQKNILTL